MLEIAFALIVLYVLFHVGIIFSAIGVGLLFKTIDKILDLIVSIVVFLRIDRVEWNKDIKLFK